MKHFTLMLIALLAGKNIFAQSPYKLETLWNYDVTDSTAGKRFAKSDDFYLLNDSSIIFLTKVFYKLPAASAKADEFYFSKVKTNGKLIINRKRIELPSDGYCVKNFDVQNDGTVIVLAIKDKTGNTDIKTDSALLISLNDDFNPAWKKFISSQNNRGTSPSRVTGVTALSNGKIIVGYNKRDTPRQSGETVKTLSLFTCFSSKGDSLFTRMNNDPIISITKGSNTAFFVQYDLNCPGGNLALHSSINGCNLKEVTNLFSTAAVQLSNFELKQARQEFDVVTISKKDGDNYSYNGPNTFALNKGDSILNHMGTSIYKNVVLFKGAAMTITSDKDGGLYVFQYLKAGSDSQNTTGYLAFCRLDSTGKDLWWFFSNDPINYSGGIPSKIMPLKGDGFIGLVYTPTGVRLLGLLVDPKKQTRGPATRMGVQETESLLQQTDNFTPGFSIKTANNPTVNSFIVTVQSNSTEKINARIVDMQGRVVSVLSNVYSNTPTSVGNSLQKGIYILEAVQGNKRALARLLKQ